MTVLLGAGPKQRSSLPPSPHQHTQNASSYTPSPKTSPHQHLYAYDDAKLESSLTSLTPTTPRTSLHPCPLHPFTLVSMIVELITFIISVVNHFLPMVLEARIDLVMTDRTRDDDGEFVR